MNAPEFGERMTFHPVSAQHCPRCNNEIASHQSLTTKRPPRPGDYTICGACLAPLRFNEGGLESANLKHAPDHVRSALELAIKLAKQQRGTA